MEYDETRRVLHVVKRYLAGFPCDVVEIVIEPYEANNRLAYVQASVAYVDDERFGGEGEHAVFRLQITANRVTVKELSGTLIREYEIDEHGNEI